MREQRTRSRAVLGLLTAGLLGTAVLAGCGSSNDASPPSAAPEPTASSPVEPADLERTSDWLAGEVGAKGFVEGQYIDHGLSLDYASTLGRVGGHEDVVDRVLDAMQSPREVTGYVSFYDEKKNGQYAGATAKLIDTVVGADRDPADYRADLVSDLEEMVVAEGEEAGRGKDTGKTDYSNTISQSYVVRALAAMSGDDVLEPAVSFLLSQQCSDGWFRESMTAGPSGGFGCEEGARGERAPSVDATAHAVQALLQVQDALSGELATEAEEAVAEAVGWLVSVQRDDGGYTVGGGAGRPNANSTGLATAALATAGEGESAGLGADWLLDLMVTEDADAALADEAGAVAFDARALTQAQDRGIKPAERYVWQRATAEAAAGLQRVAGE